MQLNDLLSYLINQTLSFVSFFFFFLTAWWGVYTKRIALGHAYLLCEVMFELHLKTLF